MEELRYVVSISVLCVTGMCYIYIYICVWCICVAVSTVLSPCAWQSVCIASLITEDLLAVCGVY